MNSLEKTKAAFSSDGTPEIPAVISYERLAIRDHWRQVTDLPWWDWYSPDLDKHINWRSSAIEKFGQAWYRIWPFYTKKEQNQLKIDVKNNKAFLYNQITSSSTELGPLTAGGSNVLHTRKFPENLEELETAVPVNEDFNPENILTDGRGDTALALNHRYGGDYFKIYHVLSPLWVCLYYFNYEDMMMKIAFNEQLLEKAIERYLATIIQKIQEAAHIGADGIWIEECMTDSISPDSFKKLNLPYLRRITDEIKSLGMKSIYYFTGNPAGKFDLILDSGADALSFEESKKNFKIDIEDLVEKVHGRCVLLGNLDSIGVLQDATEERLKFEIEKQIQAGRKNNSRFIMSLGSPATPQTSIKKIRQYCETTHVLGSLKTMKI